MAEKDLDTAFFGGITLLSLAVTTLGVVMWLQPRTTGVGSQEAPIPSGLAVKIPKVHYQDNEYLVSVRDPGEWHELREFVQPTNPSVMRIVGEIYG